MPQFKVQFYQDNRYEVFEFQSEDDYGEDWKSLFIGTLSDCEAFIRLRENENVDF